MIAAAEQFEVAFFTSLDSPSYLDLLALGTLCGIGDCSMTVLVLLRSVVSHLASTSSNL